MNRQTWQERVKSCQDNDTLVLFATLVVSYIKNPVSYVERALQAYENRDKESTTKQLQSLVLTLAIEVEDQIKHRIFFGDVSAKDPGDGWDGWWQFINVKAIDDQRCYDIYDNNDELVHNNVSIETAKEIIYTDKSIGIHSARSSRIVYKSRSGRHFVVAIAGPFGSLNFVDATDKERHYLLDRDYE